MSKSFHLPRTGVPPREEGRELQRRSACRLPLRIPREFLKPLVTGPHPRPFTRESLGGWAWTRVLERSAGARNMQPGLGTHGRSQAQPREDRLCPDVSLSAPGSQLLLRRLFSCPTLETGLQRPPPGRSWRSAWFCKSRFIGTDRFTDTLSVAAPRLQCTAGPLWEAEYS